MRHLSSVQEPQAAASTTNTSSSCPQSQTSSASGRSLSSVSRIWARLEFDWGYTYYIRLDHQGSFHTYPDLGGPYQSLKEAHKAIDRHLDEVRDPKMYKFLNSFIRRGLYWPDGTSKRRSKSHAMQKSRDQMHQMVQALLDKYNEDYHLLGDLAYELKDVLSFESISEHKSWYYHLNFSTNSKAADDSDCSTSNIFFAEVEHLRQEGHIELSVCCFCALDPINKGILYILSS
ncbi:hypothetical protein HU200_038821 [Digitaria exilis]|uniref:DUF3615 domain-containing protein n=1 Tax=Digitaria exilis TaxID=1010633 RepID=A0A835BN43_9POAL|nr:hypothetical protein HU200_038821 [Digitaria exilis]